MVEIVKCAVTDCQAEIIVQGATQAEVTDTDTKRLVLNKAAAAGLSRPGIASTISAYPVDANGEYDDELMMGKRPVAGFRADYKVMSAL